MKKDLNPPKYKIGDAIGFYCKENENGYRISRIRGIVNYENEYKYLLDEDIMSDTEINIELLMSENDIIEKLN